MMDCNHVDVTFSKQRYFYICLCIVVANLVVPKTFALDNSIEDNREDSSFKELWVRDILPRLEFHTRGKEMRFSAKEQTPIAGVYTEKDKQNLWRIKRLGISGLENLDLMTKTLDQSRLPLSVTNMNFNKLRSLMRQAGRRKK